MTNEELQALVQSLQTRLTEMEEKFASLDNSGTIPQAIDLAWLARGFVKQERQLFLDSASTATLSRTIALSGDAQNIVVPAYPFKFLQLSENPNYLVPIYLVKSAGV